MLFSEKENIFRLFGCLRIHFTENQFRCLVCSNIFTENALHSQATQFSIHFLSCKHVESESIPHSLTKETKPGKKIHQIRSNWEKKEEREATGFDWWRRMRDHVAEARSSGVGVRLVRLMIWCDRRTGAIVDLVRSLIFFLFLSLSSCVVRKWRDDLDDRWLGSTRVGLNDRSGAIVLLRRQRSSCSLSLSLSSVFQGRKSFEVKMKT